jgi:DNA-binding winged helix-turn-helix (wHTH) protein/TolB-like protein
VPLPQRYAFGDYVLERSQQRVHHRDGSTLNLTPRLFSALLLFVESAGELLDKDTLILALWPGLVVDENSLSQVVSGLRRALADDTVGSRYIQTVPRRGFRFIAPVTVLPDEAVPEATNNADRAPAHKRRWLQVALAGSIAAGLGGIWLWASRRAPTAATRSPSSTLAVLPFKPLVAEARDELLELGMADSVISHLSTVPGLVVRSIGSVRRYAGADQDPLRAALELDVAWIVDGSLQRRGDQLRVTARLLRAADGSAAWSGSFDEKFTGVFEVQDIISARVARVLTPSLEVAGGARPSPSGLGGTRNTDAYQLYLAAVQQIQGQRADGLRKAITLYNQALEIDPGSALFVRGRRRAIRGLRAGGFGCAARSGRRAESGRSACRTSLQAVLVRLRLVGCRARVSTSDRDQSERGRGSFRSGQPAVEPGPDR